MASISEKTSCLLLGALDAVLITVAQACGLQSDLREHIFAGNIVVTLTYMEPG